MNIKKTLIRYKHVDVTFNINSKKPIYALTDISIDILQGRCMAVVGESGSGKSTLARTLVKITNPNSGKIYYNNHNINNQSHTENMNYRRSVQMIFQDSFSSLNPVFRVYDILEEVYLVHHPLYNKEMRHKEIRQRIHSVGLSEDILYQYPHEISGGQRQRVGIARALACDAQCIICDEVVSALDVSVQAQIITLLKHLQKKHHLTLLFISHDLAVVKYIAHDIMVMYLGHIVEVASNTKLYDSPKHPYTQLLYSAIPIPQPRLEKRRKKPLLHGEPPSHHTKYTDSCPFVNRCPKAFQRCLKEKPKLKRHFVNHYVACHLYDN